MSIILKIALFKEAQPLPQHYDAANYREVKTPLQDIIRQKGADQQNIIFGDTNHGDNTIAGFFAGKETMKALAETGITHACLEIPVRFQGLADSYAAKKLTREEFIQSLGRQFVQFHGTKETQQERLGIIADTIDNAKSFGIKTHFVDGGEGMNNDRTPLMVSVDNATTSYLNDKQLSLGDLQDHLQNAENQEALKTYLDRQVRQSLPGIAADTDIIDKYKEDLIKSRIDKDALLAKRIDDISRGEKTAIFYGSAHGMSSRNDLNENLQGGALMITLVGKDKDWINEKDEDKPAIIHDLTTGKTTVDNENPAMSNLETAPSPVRPAAQAQRDIKPVTTPS